MIVMLDTNTVFRTRGRLLKGIDVDVLERRMDAAGIVLVVPEIVVQELVSLFRQDMKDLLRVQKKLAGLSVTGRTLDIWDVDEETKEFERQLRERLVELHARVPSYDFVRHSDVVQRIFENRRPFAPVSNGRADSAKGYRDTLIWECLLNEAATTNDRIVFVSGNIRDFGTHKDSDGKYRLFQDLTHDLEVRSIDVERIELCPSLDEFKRLHILPHLMFFDLKSNLQKGEWGHFDPASYFSERFSELFDGIQKQIGRSEDVIGQTLGVSISEPYMQMMGEVEGVQVLDVHKLDESTAIVEIGCLVNAECEFFIDRSEAFHVSENSDVTVYDYDWNEWVSMAGASLDVEAIISVITDMQGSEVQSWEVTGIKFGPSWGDLPGSVKKS